MDNKLEKSKNNKINNLEWTGRKNDIKNNY